jgi:uncharacterized membrane-anchored protein
MDRRAQLQLRLQETVEGLSVIAISYYLIGLLGHLFEAVEAAGLHLPAQIASGALVPIVVLLVAYAGRRMRRRLARDH